MITHTIRTNEHGEHVVRFRKDGILQPSWTYFASDREDAIETALAVERREGAESRLSKTAGPRVSGILYANPMDGRKFTRRFVTQAAFKKWYDENWNRVELRSVEESVAPIATPGHKTDADCRVDAVTSDCQVCGVHHGDPCETCGGRGFHVDGCPETFGSAPASCYRCDKDDDGSLVEIEAETNVDYPDGVLERVLVCSACRGHKPTVDLSKHDADALAGKLGPLARRAAEARR